MTLILSWEQIQFEAAEIEQKIYSKRFILFLVPIFFLFQFFIESATLQKNRGINQFILTDFNLIF